MALRVGIKAPDFALNCEDGSLFKLSESWAGKPGIIYFYPKDFTPGCTAEACAFRDNYQDLAQWGLPVVGISTDDESTHRRFKKQHNIPFNLLADTNAKVSALYDAKLPFLNISKRITYVIDEQHIIRLAVENFFVADTHIKEVILHLKEQLYNKVA